MKDWLKRILFKFPEFKLFLGAPYNWFVAAYLTFRYVDRRTVFPAFRIVGSVKFNIKKHKSAVLNVNGKLILEQWIGGDGGIALTMSENSTIVIGNDFMLGNGVKVYVAPDAKAVFKGRDKESASGITANAVVMVYEYLEVGKDCIIAWDTFLTDCDWHGIEGKLSCKPTIIGDHVWIGIGVKVLKGVKLKNNTIVSALSVVLDKDYPEQCLIGGNPGTVLKKDIPHWNREMESIKYNQL